MMNPRTFDELLQRAAQRGEVPGVVAIAATADEVLYRGVAGKRWLPDGPPMTIDSVFWIASMTKAITSTAAMCLVEQRRLALDEPIGNLLPELKAPQVLEGFSAAGEPRLRPAIRPITLRQLLTHTSGFGYEIWNADLLKYQEKTGTPGIITCQNQALAMPLAFDPGTVWEYGIGIDWAGKAIERVSGQTLGAYLTDNLFGPLAMKDTGFKLTDDLRRRLVGMHARAGSGALEPISFEIPQAPEFQMGGGGLYGTARDYLSFTQLFLRGGQFDGHALLRPETIAMMGQNQIGTLQVRKLTTAIPSFSNDAEFFPTMVKKWGLSFMLNTEPVPGGRSANSLAWAGLGNTYFWIDPSRQIAAVLLTQILPFADAKVLDLLGQFERAIYAA